MTDYIKSSYEWEQAQKIEQLTRERDAWSKACRSLYDSCKEGGSKGRPMDLIHKREWADIVQLIAEAEGGGVRR